MALFASRSGRALTCRGGLSHRVRAPGARTWMAMALLAACAATGSDALAQAKSPTDQARKLGQEAWQALEANNYKEALDKANEAEALYHAPTHLLLIGNAQVGLGRLA